MEGPGEGPGSPRRRRAAGLSDGVAGEGGTVALRADERTWQRSAACRGSAAPLFFPPSRAESRSGRDTREARAKAICATCPVCEPCLAEALRLQDVHGIWGGLNERERRVLSAAPST